MKDWSTGFADRHRGRDRRRRDDVARCRRGMPRPHRPARSVAPLLRRGRCRRRARRGRRRRPAPARGRQARAAAWRAASPTRTCTIAPGASRRAGRSFAPTGKRRLYRDCARASRPGGCDRDRPAGHGRVRHGTARLQSELSAVPQSLESRSYSVRLIERIGRRRRRRGWCTARSARTPAARSDARPRYRAWSAAAHLWAGQPARRDADVVLARLRRSARAHRARLRATAGRDRRTTIPRTRARSTCPVPDYEAALDSAARCRGSGSRAAISMRGFIRRCSKAIERRPPTCDALGLRSRIVAVPADLLHEVAELHPLVMKAEGAANHLDTMRERAKATIRSRSATGCIPASSFRLRTTFAPSSCAATICVN